jgi:hypothetical protein
MRIARFVLGLSLLTSLLAPGGAAAQQLVRKKMPDIQQVNGYTVRILRMERGAYGYEIRKGSTVFVHQRRNPYTGSAQGLKTPDDARKTALYVLKNIVMTDQMRPVSQRIPDGIATNRYLPSTVAASLGVTLDTSTR